MYQLINYIILSKNMFIYDFHKWCRWIVTVSVDCGVICKGVDAKSVYGKWKGILLKAIQQRKKTWRLGGAGGWGKLRELHSGERKICSDVAIEAYHHDSVTRSSAPLLENLRDERWERRGRGIAAVCGGWNLATKCRHFQRLVTTLI